MSIVTIKPDKIKISPSAQETIYFYSGENLMGETSKKINAWLKENSTYRIIQIIPDKCGALVLYENTQGVYAFG